VKLNLRHFGRSKPATASPSSSPPFHSSFQTSRSRDYTTGQTDATVESIAAEDGNAGISNPDLSGENTHPHALDILTHGHGAATGVIGHGARGDLQEVADGLEASEPKVKTAESNTLRAVDSFGSAQKKQIVLAHEILSVGLSLPTRRAFWQWLGCLVLLFVGDWSLIAVGLQIFGLSNRPWISGVGFTDDLHLAALSSVALLVLLGHGAGDKLRRIAHALERRRLAPKEERQYLPSPSAFDAVACLACVVAALYALNGLSVIRTEYLASQGTPSNAGAFLALQLGILAAAVYVSYAHANPFAKQWASQVEISTKAESNEQASVQHHDDIVGIFNADVDRLDTIVAQAGHHVDTDAANVRAQHARYKRRYTLAQSEPASALLFRDHIVDPTVYETGEHLEKVTGITELPIFAKATTDKVAERRAQVRAEIRNLILRIDNAAIAKLGLPEAIGETTSVTEATIETAAAEKSTEDTAKGAAPVTTVPTDTGPEIVDAEVVDDEDAA
jgi:hypothetical protein